MFVASKTTLKHSRKLIAEIIASSTTHEPIIYLNLFRLYTHNVLNKMSSRNFPLFHPPLYNIEYVFSVSTFLKWAERGGGFGSAISVKNCAID